MTQYSIDQVQEHLDTIIQEVEQGKAVEITRQGKQIAAFVPAVEYNRFVRSKLEFGQALDKFRQEILEEGIEIDPDEVFKDVRDRSPGREVDL